MFPFTKHAADRHGSYVHLLWVRSFSRPDLDYVIARQRRFDSSWLTCSCPSWRYAHSEGKLAGCKHIRALREGTLALRDIVRVTATGREYLPRKFAALGWLAA